MDSEAPWSAKLFSTRLARLCLTGGTTAIPRSWQDRHILFKSMQLLFKCGVAYSEAEVNKLLDHWQREVGSHMEGDRATFRRFLVDHGYLSRSTDGSRYAAGGDSGRFESEVNNLDPVEIIRNAREEETSKKKRFTKEATSEGAQ